MWFCKNSGQQSIKSSYLHIGVLNCLQLSIVDINWMAGSVFGGISYNVSTIFAKSREKSHRLWTKNLSLARGLLALQIKIPLGIHFLGPWEGGKRFYFFFLSLWLHPLATLMCMYTWTWTWPSTAGQLAACSRMKKQDHTVIQPAPLPPGNTWVCTRSYTFTPTSISTLHLQGVPLKSTPLNFLSVRPNCEIREKKLEYQIS